MSAKVGALGGGKLGEELMVRSRRLGNLGDVVEGFDTKRVRLLLRMG